MKESATCSRCGHGYTYPAELEAKAGMRCISCGALIHVKTGLPFGEAPSSASGQEKENAMKKPASLPPVKRKQASSGGDAEERRSAEKLRRQPLAAESGKPIPGVSFLAWGLALISLVMVFLFPSYGNDSTDPLYILQWIPSMIFGCTAAILFIQGLAAMRR